MHNEGRGKEKKECCGEKDREVLGTSHVISHAQQLLIYSKFYLLLKAENLTDH